MVEMKISLVRLGKALVEDEEVDGLMWVEITTPTGRVRLQSQGDYVTVSSPDGVLVIFPQGSNSADVAVVYSRDTVEFDGKEFVRNR